MYIKSLKLLDRNNSILRETLFHKGLNLVVDKDNSKEHNHVGKTTFLKLIDIALGSKDKKYLYIDAETGNKTDELEEFIENKQVSVELVLTTELGNNEIKSSTDDVILKVDLFQHGHKFINGERKNEKSYNAELNKLLFNNFKNIPSFRQTISSFVRISVKKDTNDFLHTLHGTASNLEYRSLYDFLFSIDDPEKDQKIKALNDSLNHTKSAKKRYIKVIGSRDDPQILSQVIGALSKESADLKFQLDNLIKGTNFQENREKISSFRNEYVNLEDKLNEFNYQLSQINNSIHESVLEREKHTSNELTSDFFSEMKSLIPEITKSYDQLVTFNNALYDNKIQYFTSIRDKILEKVNVLKDKKHSLLETNKNYISLIKNDDIAQYDELSLKLQKVDKRLAKQQEILTTLNKFDEETASINSDLKKLSFTNKSENDTENYVKQMDKFNEYLKPLVKEINNYTPIVVYNPSQKKFPLAIEDIVGGPSTGTFKSLKICYDIAYQQFAHAEHKEIPNFVVHDILENVEGKKLLSLLEIIDNTDMQFVAAILKEKLTSSLLDSKLQNRATILELSTTDKLFEGKS